MTNIEKAARAEAHKRYDGDRIISEVTGEEESHDDWGYADTARQAFIAGASWLADYLLSDDNVDRAARALWHAEDGQTPWHDLLDTDREEIESEARAALSAVLGKES